MRSCIYCIVGAIVAVMRNLDIVGRPIALRGQGGAVAGLWLPLGIGEASLCLPSWLSYPAMQHDKWFRKALLYLSCTGMASAPQW